MSMCYSTAIFLMQLNAELKAKETFLIEIIKLLINQLQNYECYPIVLTLYNKFSITML